MACAIHPGSPSAVTINGKGYCTRCQDGIQAAAGTLDAHVSPRDCFVWYRNSRDGWGPIAGTGCAHYVSHRLEIRSGGPGDKCLAGYTYRVPVMIGGLTQVPSLESVRNDDIWVNPARGHTGIVTRITPGVAPRNVPTIWITHASSAQHSVATDAFDVYFRGQGDFFRSSGS